MLANLVLAFAAGLLSTLSPCVLPLLPIVLGGAASESRYGPIALAGGLALSFVAIGMGLALFGGAIGLDQGLVRHLAGLLLIAAGLAMAIPSVSERVSVALSPVGNLAERTFGGFETGGTQGQFALGLLLGAVWSPCVGPTLGAASVLAAQGKDIAGVAATMALFGLGAAIPLLVLGLLSREAMQRWRNRMASAGKFGKSGLGALLVVVGVLIVTGLDKRIETALVAASPQWLTELTTRF